MFSDLLESLIQNTTNIHVAFVFVSIGVDFLLLIKSKSNSRYDA